MGIRSCPHCGSSKVQLSTKNGKHGCLWFILFGWWFIAWTIVKWVIGLIVFLLYDWWIAIIKGIAGKGHVWKCRGWFSRFKKYYYCHDCGYNFKE